MLIRLMEVDIFDEEDINCSEYITLDDQVKFSYHESACTRYVNSLQIASLSW